MGRNLVIRAWVFLAVLGLALPVAAQQAEAPLERAGAAMARLDFTTALDVLGAAIATAPDDPALHLLRADLHRRMNRPSLALDDLGAVLDADPANRAARLARADLYLALGALSRATADFDTLLEADPDALDARIGRARARTRSGLTALALADYDAALALAPAREDLAAERASLAAPTTTGLIYDPAALMDPAFRIREGAEAATAELVVVHAGNDLAREAAQMPRAAMTPALEAGALKVVHLFTYTGQDSAIWANLALICAGPAGFGATWDALSGDEASAALAAIDSGQGRAAFEALVRAVYAEAGLAPELAAECAFSRGKAFAYLADWTEKREADAWRGATIYDGWPVYVLDGEVISAPALREALGTMGPGTTPDEVDPDSLTATAEPEDGAEPEDRAEPEEKIAAALPEATAPAAPGPVGPETPDDGAAPKPEISEGETAQTAPAGAPEPAEEPPLEATETAPPIAAPTPPAPLPAAFGPIDEEARIPAALKGVWAPTLADCIAYTNAIEDPQVLDIALPGLNPLDGPAIGTVLLTSRRMLLANAVGTDCELVSLDDTAEAPWTARLACRNRIAPEIAVPMTLTQVESEGPAPRLSVEFGANTGLSLLQCRPLGGLGSDFAPLWQVDSTACTATAPVTGGAFTFAAQDGGLKLTVAPGAGELRGAAMAWIDGVSLGASGAAGKEGWQIALGPFASAADRLALGLLLEVQPTGAPVAGGGAWAPTLPLLGSGRAMEALAACAGGG